MNKTISMALVAAFLLTFLIAEVSQADNSGVVHRRSNFSNEFALTTAEGIIARGFADVRSRGSKHVVRIRVHGLPPGETYVILNHWFEPMAERSVPDRETALVDPSCNGHFQFLGEPSEANRRGELNVRVRVDQLAPHIWVANLAKFLEVTANGTQAPASPDPFTIGGLMIPYADIVALEGQFDDTDPLTDCGM